MIFLEVVFWLIDAYELIYKRVKNKYQEYKKLKFTQDTKNFFLLSFLNSPHKIFSPSPPLPSENLFANIEYVDVHAEFYFRIFCHFQMCSRPIGSYAPVRQIGFPESYKDKYHQFIDECIL
jgi:hypothetical protein